MTTRTVTIQAFPSATIENATLLGFYYEGKFHKTMICDSRKPADEVVKIANGLEDIRLKLVKQKIWGPNDEVGNRIDRKGEIADPTESIGDLQKDEIK